ncbi:MAG: topoisomerase C-terminal repeat-containing protein, partial [Myxococcota bacterium]
GGAQRQHTQQIPSKMKNTPTIHGAAQDKAQDSLGSCPACGKPVLAFPKIFACVDVENDRGGCGWRIFPKVAGKKLSKTMVKNLLANGRTQLLKGFVSKKGKRFDACLVLDEHHHLTFSFDQATQKGQVRIPSKVKARAAPTRSASKQNNMPQRTSKSVSEVSKPVPDASAPNPMLPRSESKPSTQGIGTCPRCEKAPMIPGKSAWGCRRWKEGCMTVIPFAVEGIALSTQEAQRLLSGEQISKEGRVFRVQLEEGVRSILRSEQTVD